MQRRAKLLGLDLPERREVRERGAAPGTVVESESIDEQIDEFARAWIEKRRLEAGVANPESCPERDESHA